MSKIGAGSVVSLKSGGPLMTVKWIEQGDAYCEWFSGTDVKGSKFKLVQLVVEEE